MKLVHYKFVYIFTQFYSCYTLSLKKKKKSLGQKKKSATTMVINLII